MNLTRHQSSARHLPSTAGARAAIALMVFGAALAVSNPAMAQALEPVVRGATIARDTVVAITLLLMTVGVGMVLLLPGFISGMWLSTMVNWRFAPVIFGSLAVAFIWMRIVTSRDDQRLTQMVLKLKLAVRNPNRVLRNGARSYAPIGYRGGRHVWRR
jgi:hypothetical protein